MSGSKIEMSLDDIIKSSKKTNRDNRSKNGPQKKNLKPNRAGGVQKGQGQKKFVKKNEPKVTPATKKLVQKLVSQALAKKGVRQNAPVKKTVIIRKVNPRSRVIQKSPRQETIVRRIQRPQQQIVREIVVGRPVRQFRPVQRRIVQQPRQKVVYVQKQGPPRRFQRRLTIMDDGGYDAVQKFFNKVLTDKPDGGHKSTGLAAIETLMMQLRKSKATTVRGLTEDLDNAVNAMMDTDYSSASIQSASELFLRFISLIRVEQLDESNFETLMRIYKERGDLFIKRISMSRQMIAEFSTRFIQHNVKVLVHSFSHVVLGALLTAKQNGNDFHVFVTESQPDLSGKKMIEELKKAKIDCTLVLDGAVGYLMERIDLVLLGAEGVMETGGIINKIGSLGISICAHATNKPVYVLAESIKFVKEYPLNQSDIPNRFKYRSSTLKHHKDSLGEEHPLTDYTPPEYINLLVTDLGIFTPAAVGDELIKLYT